jgi:hypothetical protein
MGSAKERVLKEAKEIINSYKEEKSQLNYNEGKTSLDLRSKIMKRKMRRAKKVLKLLS